MAFHSPPIPLIELIKSYDVTTDPHVTSGPINIILGDIRLQQSDDFCGISGKLSHETWYDSRFFLHYTDQLPKAVHCEDDIFVNVDIQQARKFCDAQMVYFHKLDVILTNPLVLNFGETSLFTPLLDFYKGRVSTHAWNVEQFAGGYGGWSFADRNLQQKFHRLQSTRTMAIENDLPAAVQFALNHEFVIVGSPQQMPVDFLQEHPHNTIFVCDIQDQFWQQQLANLTIEQWRLSAPCQPWSFAGKQDGFASANGMHLARAIAQARIHRPKTILFEQVAGFPSHCHFSIAERMFRWAGYTEVGSGVFDFADVGPVKRSRFLALFVRNDLKTSDLCWQQWPSPTRARPSQWDAIFPLTHVEAKKFALNPQDLARYFDADFFPGKHRIWSQKEILELRVPSLEGKIPTFMRAYGSQHDLPNHVIRSAGLFGHFVRQAALLRFFTPVEVAMLHGHSDSIILLKPAKLAWEFLGNSITVTHAMFLMTQAYQFLGYIESNYDPATMIGEFLQMRLQASKTAMRQDQFAWYVASLPVIENNTKKVAFFVAQMSWQDQNPKRMWPEDSFFHPTAGLCRFSIEQSIRDIQISQTQQFDVKFEMALCIIPGEYGIFMIAGSVQWSTLLALWQFRFRPMHESWNENMLNHKIVTHMVESKFMLGSVSELNVPPKIPTTISMLVRDDVDLTIYEVQHGQSWYQIRKDAHPCIANPQDAFGPIDDLQTFYESFLITGQKSEHPCLKQLETKIDEISQIKIETWIPYNTDIWVWHCQGDEKYFPEFFDLWLNDENQQWIASHGRRCLPQVIDASTWRIIFSPKPGITTTPLQIFREAFLVRMLRIASSNLHQEETNAHPIAIKYKGRSVSCQPMDLDTCFHAWLVYLEHVFQISTICGTPSMVAFGKRVTETCTTQDVLLRAQRPVEILKLHVVEAIYGGGGRNPTSKQDFQRMIESGVANLLLEYGMDLPQVAASTTKLIDNIGMPRLHTLLFNEPESQRHESFESLCKAIDLKVPSKPIRKHLNEAKYKRIRTHQANRDAKNIQIEHYLLTEGYFVNEDGTQAATLTKYSPHSSGVILMDAKAAQEWLSVTTELSPDELGIYLVGDIQIPPRFQSVATNAPARDSQGRDVLLNGVLVQMGMKHLRTATLPMDSIQIKDVQVAAITLWKDDFDKEMWEALVTHPVRTTKSLLSLDGFQGIMGKPWGRVFHHQGHSVPPNEASSIQFHCEFEKGSRFHSLLKRSGFNKIFITPKNEHGRADESWKVIWLDSTVKQIEALTTGLNGTSGLIRGKKSFGLRVESGAFSAVWDRLKPGIDKPDTRQTKYLYKLQPLPNGTDAAALIAWSVKADWNIKPIKPMGAKQWVVGSDHAPPPMLVFNSQPLLVQQLYQKALQGGHAIAAGPRQPASSKPAPFREQKVGAYIPSPNVFRTGDPFRDDWAPKAALTPQIDESHGPSTSAAAEARSTTGPVANMLQQQEDRIHQVETLVARIQESQQETSSKFEARCQHIEDAVSKHAQNTQKNFEAMHQENQSIQQTIQQAMARHDEKFAAGFDELKTLFMSARGTKRREPSEQDEEDM